MSDMAADPSVFVVGTRAQLIKVAPIIVACERVGVPCTLLMTGQHHDTMQDLLEEFGVSVPQIAALPSVEHSTVGSLLQWLPAAYRAVMARLKEIAVPGTRTNVLVHGDTLSTLLGAFAARRCGARVMHVESGLSSGRLFDPFPEEICRRLVFKMTSVAFCPDEKTSQNMRRRRHIDVINTHGNTIVDAVALTGASGVARLDDDPYVVCSLHRFQNIYDAKRLRHLVTLIENISTRYKVHFVLHPATRGRLETAGLMDRLSSAHRIILHPRMGYRQFLHRAAGAACVLTDGGSNQEELAVLGVPTIVMRARTERQDGLGVSAVLEKDIDGGVGAFVLDGRFENLRREPTVFWVEGPSARIAHVLAGYDKLLSSSME
jgi:UDP-N-acetylglucosamine 2-epimerase (non-hydrolysing)